MTIVSKVFGEATSIGYTFDPSVSKAEKVVGEHFKGIDLVTLIKDLERLLKPFAEEPVAREITVTDPPPLFKLEYKSNNYLDDDDGLQVSRIFSYDNGELNVYHEFMVLPAACRGQRLGSKVLSAFLEQYEKMGVKRIKVHAGLADGGAVWARVGFKATGKKEMERILQTAKTRLGHLPKILKTVEDTFNIYYDIEPDGKAFPINKWAAIPAMVPILKMNIHNRHGEIDLTNKQDLLNFKINVGEKE